MWERVLALGCLTVLATAPAASAKTLPDQTLEHVGQVVTWAGRSTDPTGTGYGPATQHTCSTDTCDELMLKLDLPASAFPKGPKNPSPPGVTRTNAEGPTDMPGDGVLIAIRWATDFDQWNLFVDDASTGETVAQALDVDSNSQSVLLSRPHNGLYRIRIVPFMTATEKADLEYSAEAQVFHDPSQRHRRPTRLLPRIRTVAPDNFHLADIPPIASNPTGWRYTPDGTFDNSCYLDEGAQFGSTRCLRFDNDIRNVGAGPLVMRFAYTPDAFVNNCKMEQEVLTSDGKVSDRGAGPCVFHAPHGHFHYQNMARYQLFAVNAKGRPGRKPIAASNKVGFCTIDVDNFSFGRAVALQRPRVYSFPTCNIPNAYSTELAPSTPYGPGGVPEYMGISPGWGDIYTWDLPQQYIDVSKVSDGDFMVVSRSNPDGAILTSGGGQETGLTCIRIKGNDVKVLRRLPSQSNRAPLPSCAVKRKLSA
jgi:hypothetical protein